MVILWDLVEKIIPNWWRRGELNPCPKIASVMTLHV